MDKTKEQLAKEYAHIGDMDGVGGEDYEDDLRIAFTAGYDECEKNMIDKACKLVEILFKVLKTYDNKEALMSEFKKVMTE